MIESITICEYVTEDLKPINKKNIFFPTDLSVQVLVKMKKMKMNTNILFNWYIEGNPDILMGSYEIPIKGKDTYPRFAVGLLDIPLLLSEKDDYNPFKKWYVLIKVEGSVKKERFEIKNNNSYNGQSEITTPYQSRYSWNA